MFEQHSCSKQRRVTPNINRGEAKQYKKTADLIKSGEPYHKKKNFFYKTLDLENPQSNRGGVFTSTIFMGFFHNVNFLAH